MEYAQARIDEMLQDLEGPSGLEIFEGDVVAIETDEGVEYFPLETVNSLNLDDYKNICSGVPFDISVQQGFAGRLSCTEFIFAENYPELVERMYQLWS